VRTPHIFAVVTASTMQYLSFWIRNSLLHIMQEILAENASVLVVYVYNSLWQHSFHRELGSLQICCFHN
jgi:hypothetical protein